MPQAITVEDLLANLFSPSDLTNLVNHWCMLEGLSSDELWLSVPPHEHIAARAWVTKVVVAMRHRSPELHSLLSLVCDVRQGRIHDVLETARYLGIELRNRTNKQPDSGLFLTPLDRRQTPPMRWRMAPPMPPVLVGVPTRAVGDGGSVIQVLSETEDRDRQLLQRTRRRDLQNLLAMLTLRRAVIVTGDSGVGKSSLLRGGLLGTLTEREYRHTRAIYVGGQYTDPAVTLLDAISALAGAATDASAPLADRWVSVISALGETAYTVLVLDQFEQVLLDRTQTARVQFVDVLLRLLAHPTLALSLVIAVRSEWYTRVASMLPVGIATSVDLSRHTLVVEGISPDIMAGASELLSITPLLAEAITSDLAESTGAVVPIEYSLVVATLHRSRIGDVFAYRRKGGLAACTLGSLSSLIRDQPAADRPAVLRLLLCLGRERLGRVAIQGDRLSIASMLPGTPNVAELLGPFVDGGFVNEIGGSYEYSHDFFADAFRRLAEEQVGADTNASCTAILSAVTRRVDLHSAGRAIQLEWYNPGYDRRSRIALMASFALHSAGWAVAWFRLDGTDVVRLTGALFASLSCAYIAHQMTVGPIRLMPTCSGRTFRRRVLFMWGAHYALAVTGLVFPKAWLLLVGGGALLVFSGMSALRERYSSMAMIEKQYGKTSTAYLIAALIMIAFGLPKAGAVPGAFGDWVSPPMDLVIGGLLCVMFTWVGRTYSPNGPVDWRALRWSGELQLLSKSAPDIATNRSSGAGAATAMTAAAR